jgi:dihydroorotase
MKSTLIVNSKVINDGEIRDLDLYIKNGVIDQLGSDLARREADQIIDGKGKFLIPGIIDDQVHFREPGLTHKATIKSESRAAIAGGVTSFMEMPNTIPQALTQELLEEKYNMAATDSLANYSFYMGVSNHNIEEVLKTPADKVCGVKVFLGSSTGEMLVDNQKTLDGLFSRVEMLIAAHCEDEEIIRKNTLKFKEQYGENIPFECHPLIRDEDACFQSSSRAVDLAKQYGTRLHILHISTAKELGLFDNSIPLERKRITSEACIHHLWFTDQDYQALGSLIKWNPAVKTRADRDEIRRALLDDRIDVIATDHAPHTLEEKRNKYLSAPSGGPLIQHGFNAMFELYRQDLIPLTKIVEKMCHNPALLFGIDRRGFIREGYYADLALVDPQGNWVVSEDNILAKCGWSPFSGQVFHSSVTHTFVSGHLAYSQGFFNENKMGERLLFNRK